MMRRWLPADRLGWWLLGIGLIALALCVVCGWQHARQAWLGYLVVYLFALSLALGSMAMMMVHALTGGAWGYFLRPRLLAATRTLPLLALGLLPLLWAAPMIFTWMQAVPAHDADFARQTWYLNRTFLSLRALLSMALWLLLSAWLSRCLDAAQAPRRLHHWAIIGLIVYVVSVTLFAVDWIMALQPRWHSSTFGLTMITAQMLIATAWAAVGAAHAQAQRREPAPALLGDLGKWLLMFVLAFAYLAFMDYLTAWTGNLPAETLWYIPRTLTSWKWLAAFVIVGVLIVPFIVLITHRGKRHVGTLGVAALAMLVAQFSYLLWLVVPVARGHGFALYWTDGLAWLGLGALWWWVFARNLKACLKVEMRQREVVA